MTTPPEVVLILASSTVFVKASSLVNLDLGGIVTQSSIAEFRLGSTGSGRDQVHERLAQG